MDSSFGISSPEKLVVDAEGIAFAPDGSLLVGDGEQHEVFRVTRDGNVSEFLGKEYGITRPEGLVYDDKGNLYIADEEDNVLYMLDPSRKLHRLIDRRESFSPEALCYVYVYTQNDELKPIAAFAGTFRQLQGITIDDGGDIYVAVQTDLKHKVGHIIKISKENSEIAKK